MSEFFYVVKIAVATVVFIIIMQTQWGNKPLEGHLVTWIRTSSMIEPVRDFSERGAVIVRKTYRNVTAFIDSKLKSNARSSNRKSIFNLKRDASVEDAKDLETDESQAGL